MLEKLKDNLLFVVFITVTAQTVVFTAKAGLPVPEDAFQNQLYWEAIGRAALEGLFTGLLSVVSIVAVAFGIEVKGLPGKEKIEPESNAGPEA